MLANGVGDAFRFHLAGAAVYAGLLLVFGSVQVNIVQLCVGDFVNGGFERLQLAHTLVKRDALVLQVIIAVSPPSIFSKPMGTGEVFSRAAKKSLYCSTSPVSASTAISGNSFPSVWDTSKTDTTL